jgi:DNA adenine methylase
MLSSMPRPFVRWAGSKHRMLPQLVPFMPREFRRYHEPFFGAGAMFFFLRPERARLSDVCSPLVDMYNRVRTSPQAVYENLVAFDLMDSELYYRERKLPIQGGVEQAARFLYLNRAGWNGLYRVNAAGTYNVPYGRPKSPNHTDHENFMVAGGLLAQVGVTINLADYSSVESEASEGDFVYFDPPYVTGHNDNGFADYNENLFSWSDQEALAQLAARLQARGVQVLVSNAFHDGIVALYPTFSVAKVTRQSTLAGNMSARGKAIEAVFH